MKVLYVTSCTIEKSSGVSKKILSQCRAMKLFSEKVDLVSLAFNDTRFIVYSEEGNSGGKFNSDKNSNATIFSKIMHKIKKVLCPVNITNFIDSYDVIYIRRFVPLIPSYISFIKKIKKEAKVYYEIPTYPYLQEHMSLSIQNITILPFEYKSIERLKKVVDEFVVVTEIEDKKARERLGKYRIIPNGFDVSSVTVRNVPPLNNEVHILGLANVAFWHGYDRIISGMANYKGHYRIIFHLVGGKVTKEIEKLRCLATKLGVANDVIFYKPLYGKELDNIFNICHVAAGSLGIHRIGLLNVSALKLYEYCARGIPFFMSYNDDSLKAISDFYHLIDADDTPVDINELCLFIERVSNINKDCSLGMRKYAEENIDWKNRMRKIFE